MTAKICDNEDPGRSVSWGVISADPAKLASIQPSVSAAWVTPLGMPVLPEVKKTQPGSLAFNGLSFTSGGVLSISSSILGLSPSVAP